MDISNVYHGIVHGKTIELFDDPGVPAGAHVAVQVQSIQEPPASQELRSPSAGAWADFAEMDVIMADVERGRSADVRPEVEL